MMRKRYTWIILLAIVILAGISGYKFYENSNASTAENLKSKSGKVVEEEYDVIVIGGEPEGVAAAIAAGRNGAKTLLVEHREELGGLFTYGMLNFLDIPQGENGESVSKGIFEEWHRMVGGKSAFGIGAAKDAFRQLVEAEPNVTTLTKSEVLDVVKDDNDVIGIKLQHEGHQYEVKGKTFIDATQDADFAVMSGVPYFTGGEDIGIKDKKMAVTLMIHLKNVDWEGIRRTVESEKFGPAEITDSAAWGFVDLHHVYPAVEKNTRLRGLNLAKVNDDYYINALQIFGVDGLDEESKQEGIERGKREIDHILEFLRKEFPGFEHAEIASYPTELYVRETRHIQAEYQLPMSDLWTNRDHWDSIGLGAYPVDIQAQTPQDYGYVVADPKQYAIPFRSLVPKEIDGLLVVGRSSGYSSIAAGSARVVPTGMVTGEAAGTAAALAVKENTTFRDMSQNKELIEILRETLAENGAFVDHFTIDYPYQGEWYDESIQTLIDYGLIFGRYENDMKVEEKASRHEFMRIVKEGMQRSNPEAFLTLENKVMPLYNEISLKEDGSMTRDEASAILGNIFLEDMERAGWSTLMEHELIHKELFERIPENRELLNKELYAICASVITNLQNQYE